MHVHQTLVVRLIALTPLTTVPRLIYAISLSAGLFAFIEFFVSYGM